MNPFWFTAVLLCTFIGGAGLVLTALAGVLWLFKRSKVTRLLFVGLLICTVLIGVVYVTSLMLIGTDWP